ncbi:alanine racemase [Anaerosphaera multitolerans]|uniref:Alanine racemase n=1 Tax=Anaerosphaera multitolerans TaxID=2487351 RepID=A0A437S882_9FIRM|nr:alanine racemase [Anaerosphaera multitolerans]RVU55295.1 alanine racemase [Anaerosphaera multitolerans]
MKLTRSSWLEVNLDKLVYNIEQIRSILDKNVKIISVVKSNAYGFGSLKIVETLREEGINFFAVATNSEAIKIRRKFKDIDILILGYTPEYVMADAIENNIIMATYSLETAEILSKIAVSLNKVARIHLVVDSGMNRIGFKVNEDSINEVVEISKLNNVKIEGIFSHFAAADSNFDYTESQYRNFIFFVKSVEDKGVDVGIRHINNSQGVINYREYSLDGVRPGIVQYGSTEGVASRYENFNVEYIGEIKAEISHLKIVKKGEKVGYGLTYEAEDDIRVATLPIGYADGIIRQLSGKIDVLIGGKRCPQIGRICMDQMMIDVSKVNCKIGDEAVLLGKQGEEEISIGELAEKAGEVDTSFSCHFSMRLPRVYIKNSQVESIYDINLE